MKKIFIIIIVFLSIGFMFWLFAKQWMEFRQLDWNCNLHSLFIIFLFCLGGIFVVFIPSFYSISHEHWSHIGSTLAFFCIGFIIIFIPVGIGIGIRESVIYLLLIQFLPTAHLYLSEAGYGQYHYFN